MKKRSSNRIKFSDQIIYPNRFTYLVTHYKKGKILDLGNLGEGQGRSKSRSLDFLKHLDSGSTLIGLDLFRPDKESRLDYRNQVQGNLEQGLPFKDETFDTVYAGQILEHMGNPLSVLNGIHRILKNDGIFILDIPNPYALRRLLRWLFKKEEYLGDPTHLIFYSPASLRALLIKAGYRIVEITNDWESKRKTALRFIKVGLGSHLLARALK